MVAKTSRGGVEGRGVVDGPSVKTRVGVRIGPGTVGAAFGAAVLSLTELSKMRDLILLPRKDFLQDRLQEAHAR